MLWACPNSSPHFLITSLNHMESFSSSVTCHQLCSIKVMSFWSTAYILLHNLCGMLHGRERLSLTSFYLMVAEGQSYALILGKEKIWGKGGGTGNWAAIVSHHIQEGLWTWEPHTLPHFSIFLVYNTLPGDTGLLSKANDYLSILSVLQPHSNKK